MYRTNIPAAWLRFWDSFNMDKYSKIALLRTEIDDHKHVTKVKAAHGKDKTDTRPHAKTDTAQRRHIRQNTLHKIL